MAATGVFRNTRGWLIADGLASVTIGCLLGAVGAYLSAQNRDLVVKETHRDGIGRTTRDLAMGKDRFLAVRADHSVPFAPELS